MNLGVGFSSKLLDVNNCARLISIRISECWSRTVSMETADVSGL